MYSESRSEIEMLFESAQSVDLWAIYPLSQLSDPIVFDCPASGRKSGGTGKLEQFGCAVNIE